MEIFAETERLVLREIMPSDIEGMYELDSNPEVHKYIDNKPVKSKDEVIKTINFIRQQYAERGIGRWAAIEKSSGDFIGWSGLKFNTGEQDSLNGKQDFYDIGYRFIPRYWNKGYATESALAALDYGFKVKKYKTIAGIALVDNIGSNKVLRKIGLKHVEDFIYEDTKASWYELDLQTYKTEAQRKEVLRKKNLKYETDKAFREKTKTYYREKYKTDEDYRKKTLEAARKRYHEDPEYRQKTIERAKARHKNSKQS